MYKNAHNLRNSRKIKQTALRIYREPSAYQPIKNAQEMLIVPASISASSAAWQ